MNWGGYMILGVVIVVLLYLYARVVLTYVRASKRYRTAKRVNAIMKEDLGDMKMAIRNITFGVSHFRVFHRYKVSFWLEGTEYVKEAEQKNRKLNVGDNVEVRYHISEKGELQLESEAFLCWSRERAVGYTIGLILGIVLSVLKTKGII